MSLEPARQNRLSRENSPYLLQHATNPVDWFPWGEEAFTKARQEDKPLFLSIGYSSCHWCHVMREESFADPAIARIMNDSFVAVKVDREERPDIDHVYMQVASLLIGRAGWPLTVFLTPERLPFYAGTYFPPHARYGMPGLDNVLQRIAELWAKDRRVLLSSAETVTAAIRAAGTAGTPRDPGTNLISLGVQDLDREYDRVHRGFGGPPKFPPPLQCIFLLRHWYRSGDAHAREMATETLRMMRQGGVYDHVGGGFHRYATDAAWQIPHFEKMLTDQALCALACTEAFQASGAVEFRDTATETLSYVIRDLGAAEGGLYTAEDAESEGVEGKFYVWTPEEVRAVLGDERAQQVAQFMTIDQEGNFSAHVEGAHVLALRRPIADLSAPEKDLYTTACRLLFAARARRTRPARDEKILCDGNGLAIAAFARAGRVFGEERFIFSAQAAARFLLDRFRREGRLHHRYYKGETGVTARAGDYAFLIWGLIELYAATFDAEWFAAACELQDECTRHLAHPEGGYYLAPRDETDLIFNPVEARDGAVPAGNGIIYQNLVNLSRLTGHTRFGEQSHALARTFGAETADAPASHCSYLIALDLALGPVVDIVVTGAAEDSRTRGLIAAARSGYDPQVQILLVPDGPGGNAVRRIAPFTAGLPAGNLQPAAHLCSRGICSQPIRTPEEVRRAIGRGGGDERIAS